MITYSYRAKMSSGETVSGTIAGENQARARAQLRDQGLFVLELKERKEHSPSILKPAALFNQHVIKPLFAGATAVTLAAFYRQMERMMSAGVTVFDAMSALAEMRSNRWLSKIAAEMLPWLQAGRSLSEGFARYPWMFSDVQIKIIEAGEASGTLARAFTHLADYLEWEFRIRQRLRLVTFYPKVLVLCIIFIPNIRVLVFGSATAYFVYTGMLLLRLLIVIGLIWSAHRLLTQIPSVRYDVDKTKAKIPQIGAMVRALALSRFYRSFALMYASGIPLAQGLELAADGMGNTYLARRLKTAVPLVRNGHSILRALAETREIPNGAVGMLNTGETTGNVDEALEKLAELAQQDAEFDTAKNIMMLSVALMIVIGGYIILMYLGAVLGMVAAPVTQ